MPALCCSAAGYDLVHNTNLSMGGWMMIKKILTILFKYISNFNTWFLKYAAFIAACALHCTLPWKSS